MKELLEELAALWPKESVNFLRSTHAKGSAGEEDGFVFDDGSQVLHTIRASWNDRQNAAARTIIESEIREEKENWPVYGVSDPPIHVWVTHRGKMGFGKSQTEALVRVAIEVLKAPASLGGIEE